MLIEEDDDDLSDVDRCGILIMLGIYTLVLWYEVFI